MAAGTPGATRDFGRGAYEGIRAAVAAPRACDLSDNLTALVMAPIFKEVSMAETPEAAPSPMTLSRWDDMPAPTGRPASDMDCQRAPGDDPAPAGAEPTEPGATEAAGEDGAGGDGHVDQAGDGAAGDGAAGDDEAAGEAGPAAPEPAIRLRDGLALIPPLAG